MENKCEDKNILEELGYHIIIRDNIPLPKGLTPIYRNPCRKCIVRACCNKPCRDKAIYESSSYWRKVKFQHILVNTLSIVIAILVLAGVVWGFKWP